MFFFMNRYINELIESLLLVLNDGDINWMGGGDHSSNATSTTHNHDNHTASADWAQMLDAATQRRTEVLMPENLENMWARGRNYGRETRKNAKSRSPAKHSSADHSLFERHFTHETSLRKPIGTYAYPLHSVGSDPILYDGSTTMSESSMDHDKSLSFESDCQVDEVSDIKDLGSDKQKLPLRRTGSGSSSLLGAHPHKGGFNAEFHAPEFKKHEGFWGKSSFDMVTRREGQGVPKLRCRVCTLDYKSCEF